MFEYCPITRNTSHAMVKCWQTHNQPCSLPPTNQWTIVPCALLVALWIIPRLHKKIGLATLQKKNMTKLKMENEIIKYIYIQQAYIYKKKDYLHKWQSKKTITFLYVFFSTLLRYWALETSEALILNKLTLASMNSIRSLFGHRKLQHTMSGSINKIIWWNTVKNHFLQWCTFL